MTKLAISGACGKMGSRILKLALEDESLLVRVALEKEGHPRVGSEINGIRISDDPDEIKRAEALIEFTTPLATIEHLEVVLRYKKAMVIGTTGLSPQEQDRVKGASGEIPIVFSPNMSIGVNLAFSLVKKAAQALSKDYIVKIVESHHVHKKDAPSGTAKKLAQIVKEAQGREVADIRSIREDEIVGDHEIVFESPMDTIKIFHSAKTRDIFACGALTAAKWIVGKGPGLYTMEDVLGIKQ